VDKYQDRPLSNLFTFKSTKVLPTPIRLSVVNYWTGISVATKRKDIGDKM